MSGDMRAGPIPRDRLDTPAVGLVVDGDTDSDRVAGAVLRATRANHHVLVGVKPDVEDEVETFAEELGATTLDLSVKNEDDARDQLVDAARKAGFPGVLFQPELSFAPDYARSAEDLSDSDRYWHTVTQDIAGTDAILVGIPAYNEEVGIGSVVTAANEYADEVLVVDDGSTDDTATIARNAGATVIHHDSNRGKGAAVETLLSHAEESDPDALVFLDGDGQHRAGDIPAIADPVLNGTADLVIGSRYLDGRNGGGTPLHRRFGQRVLDVATYVTSGEQMSDSQSGFRALSPAAIEALEVDSHAFGVESGMIDSAAAADLTIEEVSIDGRYKGVPGRQTQNPLRHGLSVLMFVLQLVRDRHPLVFFGAPGLVLMLAGGFYGVNAILIYQSTGQFYAAKVLVGGFLTMFGMLAMFTGLILNRIGTTVAKQTDD